MRLATIENCTGCGACTAICPKEAISIKLNDEGFFSPIVNEDLCINCGACTRICPKLNPIENNNSSNPESYACWIKDFDILKKSTSGGVFTALAENILKDGGEVVASEMDNNLDLFHKVVCNDEELEDVRGSKYTQSKIDKEIYLRIVKNMKEKRKTLFVGTPCQVVAINKFLKQYDTQFLYTVDLVCHGVGSTKFFMKYINEIEKEENKKVVGFSARNKKNGWNVMTSKIIFEDNSEKFIKAVNDKFMKCYLAAGVYRECCYTCPYARVPRVGDLTLADYFGIKKQDVDKECFKNGISLVLINNDKGKELFEKIQCKLVVEKRELCEGTVTNPSIIRPMPRHKFRDEVFKNMDKMSIKEIDKKYFDYSLKSKISHFIGPKATGIVQMILRKFK